jgi:RNA polymerase sigma factor (TIGR02999 family)
MLDPTAGNAQVHFTGLCNRAIKGDRLASNLLYEVALPRLTRIAAALLHRHRTHQTLPPTALVNESWLKLRCLRLPILEREQFFRISARAMRQVLIDHGRAKSCRETYTKETLREPAPRTRFPDSEFSVARDVLDRFERIDRSAARIIRLHYIEGYSWDEISRVTGLAVWRVRDDAGFALNWMRNHLD